MNPINVPHRSRGAAFTLIELLTVITIIAILMGLLYPVVMAAKEAARRSTAGVTVRNIVNACKAYANEYGKFPSVPGAAMPASNPSLYSYGDTTNGNCKLDNSELFNILRALPLTLNANNLYNPRQQKYFEAKNVKDPKNPRDGFVLTGAASGTVGALLDPWGNEYCVVLDATGTDQIGGNFSGKFYADPSFSGGLMVSAAAFSMGKDGKIGDAKAGDRCLRTLPTSPGPNAGQLSDDVVSFQ